MTSSPTDSDSLQGLIPSPLTFPVVGIGGSAGGLQALLDFFKHMPPDPGMAFVVILHLARDHESNASEILQRATSMPVAQVTSSVAIEANHIYVIAPRADLIMNDGHLEVGSPARATGPAVAIDVFFRTLAQVHKRHAVCIVMSGTGSDGAVGLTRVKEEGGITIAQSAEDAEHDAMPRAAVATGMVDLVLPAAAMGPKLVELWANTRKIQVSGIAAGVINAEREGEITETNRDELVRQEVMALLKLYTRHDFSHYKPGTVARRVERRLQVNGLASVASYRDFLRDNPGEASHLLQDMLISVTSFFRDPEAFDVLEHGILQKIVQHRRPGDQTRVWVAGCATGEESYSLSMLLLEKLHAVIGQPRHRDVQIFATDIDERAIATARRGVYPAGIAADVSPERLARFFTSEQGQFRVATEVREQMLFATHNLLRDPPFSKLDLVCCRNLLIYLDQSAQANALEMFRYALKPGGYLFLGTSESADAAGNLFTAVDKKYRIYRVNPGAPTRGHLAYIGDRSNDAVHMPPQQAAPTSRTLPQLAVVNEHLLALQGVSPASVLVDGQHNMLHLSPTADRFMVRSGGVPSDNLLDNVAPELRLELRTALFKASESGVQAHARVRNALDGSKSAIDLDVYPLDSDEQNGQRTLIVFREIGQEQLVVATEDPGLRDSTHQLMIGKLEDDNRQLKVHLQDTLERSALSNEELKASNEELQAINEELRSATEELETSKEELQSMNEELGTVNVELRNKVEERGQINDDLQNLISSSEVATVFVDSAMFIKRFTPQASKLFSLIASDVGRSLLDITNRLNYGELANDAAAVFKDLRIIERQITTTDDRRLFARILPYRTAGDKIEGAVLTFFDVTQLKKAEDQVRVGEERLRMAAATTNDFAIITTNEAGDIATWNAGAERIFGYRSDEMEGRSIAEIFTPDDRKNGVPEAKLKLAAEVGRSEDEGWRQRKDGSTFFCSGVLTRLQTTAGNGFCKIARDLTGSKRQELAMENLLLKEQQASSEARRDVEMKDKFLAVMSHELKQPLNLIQVSAELLTRVPETRDLPLAVRIGRTIQRAVASQTQIINDLLDLSRIRTGKLRLNLAEVDLKDMLSTLAQACSEDLAKKKITIDVGESPAVICRCDRVRVEQLVWNLLSNAIKFTPAGGHLAVHLSSDGGFARITVSDTGSGISAEFLPHVFEMFNQADAQLTPTNGGMGIGLALVQELAKAHGGGVDASSDGIDKGATFKVWLPLSSEPVADPATAPSPLALDLGGWKILAVDDSADSLDVFAQLLEYEGAIVDTAESAEIALNLMQQRTYDLLISDIGMPGVDGFAFITEVRRRHSDKALLAIAVSGFGRATDSSKAKAAGFDAHIAKPMSIPQLKDVVSKLMATDVEPHLELI